MTSKYCPRLDSHFVKLEPTGELSACCHMTNSPKRFNSFDEIKSSEWLKELQNTLNNGTFPAVCKRCEQEEEMYGDSIRTRSIIEHNKQTITDYITADVVLDNICNSACQFCSPIYSTKLGSLVSKTFPIIDNSSKLSSLPIDKITHLDISGGEPGYSKKQKELFHLKTETYLLKFYIIKLTL